ncbi:hypothetical protein CLAIMM_09687 isoform 1 [Cladophialophora immunda]|nr:hypothetical protein CLAIMM_09687 isoform 1 [Cladophialophora immunda]
MANPSDENLEYLWHKHGRDPGIISHTDAQACTPTPTYSYACLPSVSLPRDGSCGGISREKKRKKRGQSVLGSCLRGRNRRKILLSIASIPSVRVPLVGPGNAVADGDGDGDDGDDGEKKNERPSTAQGVCSSLLNPRRAPAADA